MRLFAGLLVLAVPLKAFALEQGSAPKPTGPRGTVTGSAAQGPSASATPEGEDTPPADHPDVDEESPHAHAGHGSEMPGMFQPPEDVEQQDATLPPGEIEIDLRDADDKPLPREVVTLGILINSIAKGDRREHQQGTTDERGRVVFSGLETASNIAYRVSSGYQGGSFAATPFQLQQAKAMHVVLHVYPVTRDIQQAMIVCEAALAAEVRDDRIQVEQVFTVYNLGRTAWQPDDVRIPLPEGTTAFNAQASMSDQGVDEVGGAAKLRGTFPPGKHAINFRWQLPWSGERDMDFEVGLPPHVAVARVMMPASAEIKLLATGFPPAEVRHDAQGQSFLVSERHVTPGDAKLSSLTIGIHDLPTPGLGRLFATLLASCGVGLGLFLGLPRRGHPRAQGDPLAIREAILRDLFELERARETGDVGPQTYERARGELLDALARTLLET